ncbi:hypothetical protein HY642_04855 [Candidatus Woesearchaeota archaeon]|nr:hypothetical protein [Candidatus Woesearchaeota archaeon]
MATDDSPCLEHRLWSVWRQDDNGNAVLVKDALPREQALSLVEQYQQQGHKQLYWAEPQEIEIK